jgi:hypothetical protein
MHILKKRKGQNKSFKFEGRSCDWSFQLSRVGKSWNYILVVYNIILAISIPLKLDYGNPNYIFQHGS